MIGSGGGNGGNGIEGGGGKYGGIEGRGGILGGGEGGKATGHGSIFN